MNNNDTFSLSDVVTSRMIAMYGVASIGKWYDDNTELFSTSDKMLVMSMLSDVQEMIERGLDEEARQTLNRAKWVISNKL